MYVEKYETIKKKKKLSFSLGKVENSLVVF